LTGRDAALGNDDAMVLRISHNLCHLYKEQGKTSLSLNHG
jgi:hypothetical protein